MEDLDIKELLKDPDALFSVFAEGAPREWATFRNALPLEARAHFDQVRGRGHSVNAFRVHSGPRAVFIVSSVNWHRGAAEELRLVAYDAAGEEVLRTFPEEDSGG